MTERRLRALPISPGLAISHVHVMTRTKPAAATRSIEESETGKEYARFIEAVGAVKDEVKILRERTAEEIGEKEAAIFDAHLMVLDDPLLHMEVSKNLKAKLQNVETVLSAVIRDLTESFAAMPDTVMSERSADVADVGERLIRQLAGAAWQEPEVTEPSILFAPDLPPSVAAILDSDHIQGLILEVGSPTSHTAILANALGIPAVVVKPEDAKILLHGSFVILDGLRGEIIIDPEESTAAEYHERMAALVNLEVSIRSRTTLTALTLDGVSVEVMANLEIPSEIAAARDNGAQGVGLYRTEYLFMNRKRLPDEEEQFRHYRLVVDAFSNMPVTLRTIDVGGDKFLSDTDITKEINPFLGLRAIRFSLRYPDMFHAQLRAMVRASRHGQVKIMFPMIACLEEIEEVRKHLDVCINEVGIAPERIDVGIMIETPAAALAAHTLARHVDFFSLGTNDLIQYTMAAERGNEALSYLHEPTYPPLLRLIREVAEAGRAAGIDVSVCGQCASDLRVVPLLVGAGVSSLSVNPRAIPAVKELLRRISFSECRDTLDEAGTLLRAEEVRFLVEKRFSERVADLGSLTTKT